MKFAISIISPEVPGEAPLALLSGSFQQRLAKAAAYGYKGVELVVSDVTKLDPDALVQEIRSYGLEPVAVATGYIAGSRGLNLVSPDPRIRRDAAEVLVELVEFAHKIGVNLVTIGGFRGKAEFVGSLSLAKEYLHEAISQAEPLALERGITIALEPLRAGESDLLNSAREVCDFITEGGHRAAGLLLDLYHMMGAEPDLVEAFRIYREQLVHVHLADTGRVALGRGELDYAPIEAVLQEIGYRGWQSVELPRKDSPDENGYLPGCIAKYAEL